MVDWLAWLELGNKAARTLDTYERYVAGLLRDWPDTDFAEFSDTHLLHTLKKHPPKSRHLVKASWNNWFGWGYKFARRIPGNPVDLLPQITYKPNRAYDLFTDAEVEALCALPTPDGELQTLMHHAGLRRAECRLLTGKRIDFAKEQVIVKEGAKGSKQRLVPMDSTLSRAMADLLQLEGIDRNDHLWSHRPGGGKIVRRDTPVGNTTFDSWWKRCLDDAGVRHRNPHMARHSFATRLRRLGVPMEDIQQHLGHEKISTTSDTYVHADFADRAQRLREAVGDL
jgi:integrase